MSANRSSRALAAVFLACGVGGGASLGQVGVAPILVSGDPAPGLPDLSPGFISLAHLNGGGDIVVAADLEGEGIDETNESVVYLITGGEFVVRYREGDPIFEGAGATFASLPDPALSAGSLISLSAGVVDPDFDSPDFGEQPTIAGVFSESEPGLIGPLALEFDPAVGLEGNFGALSQAPINAQGHVAFTGSDQSGDAFAGDVSALWTDRSGALELLVRSGDVLAGAPEGGVVGVVGPPAMNGAGTIVFRVSLVDALDSDLILAHAIYRSGVGSPISPVAITGDPAPGVPGGVFERVSRTPGIDDAGRVLFFATVAGEGIGEGNDGGLWRAEADGAPEPLIREGYPIPQLGGGVVLARMFEDPALSEQGNAVFNAFVSGPGVDETNNGVLLHAGTDGSIGVLAREGDQAAGLAPGITYATFERPAVAGERVAFAAMLGGMAEVGGNRALFTGDLAGQLSPLARTGEEIDLSGDGSDVREILDISFGDRGLASGRGSLDSVGTVLFKLWFAGNEHALMSGAIGCPADIDGDGELDIFDFVAFQSAFMGGLPAADCDQDGELDIFDFVCFQQAFLAGCP